MTDGIKRVRDSAAGIEDIDSGSQPPPPRTPDVPAATGSGGPVDPLFEAAKQPLNDYGNGQRFVIHFGADVMFVPRVGWFTWSGKCWVKDPDELAVRSMAQQIWQLIESETKYIEPNRRERRLLEEKRRLLDRQTEMDGLPDAERAEGHDAEMSTITLRLKTIDGIVKSHETMIGRRLTHAKNAGNAAPLKNMLIEAQTSLAVALDDLDADPFVINTASGALQFTVTGGPGEGFSRTANMVLFPHDRAQRLTKMIEVDYDPAAEAPLFHAYLERVQPNIEMRRFLQRWFGLAMTAHTGEQKLAFFYGSGANGKSVMVDLIARILGNYSATARIESLTGSTRRGGGDATPDLIPLIGARFVRAAEPDEGTKLQEGLLKEMTGGEPILARALHADFVEVKPVFKLTISGNHKPDIRGTDDGIWRRVLLVPWDIQIPPDERDPRLGEKLWNERSGILNWMIEGLMEYLEAGLAEPEDVIVATSEYREESDPIGAFLLDCCTVTGQAADSITAKDLNDAFRYWQLERGAGQWQPGTVAKKLAEKAGRWKDPKTGRTFERRKSSIMRYDGLQMVEPFHKRFRNAPRDHRGNPIGVAEYDDTPDPDMGGMRE